MPDMVTIRAPAFMFGASRCTISRNEPIVIAYVLAMWCALISVSGLNAVAACIAPGPPACKSEVVVDFIVEDRLLSPAEYYADQPAGVTPLEPCQVVVAVV